MRNVNCTRAVAVLLFGAMAATASAQPRTYPKPLRGIPAADYQFRLRSSTLVELSSPMIPIQSVRPVGAPPNTLTDVKNDFKLFQLPKKELELHGRKISRAAFMVHQDGTWSLSLRGDFHDQAEAIAGPYFDAHHRRCQFRVKVNCFGSYAVTEDASNSSTGKPVVLETPPIEFWVQSGVPYDLWRVGMCKGWDDETRLRVFELLDRVEIEFAYYHPAGYSRPVRDVSVLP